MAPSLVQKLGQLGCHQSARKFRRQGELIFHLFQSLGVSHCPSSFLDIFAHRRIFVRLKGPFKLLFYRVEIGGMTSLVEFFQINDLSNHEKYLITNSCHSPNTWQVIRRSGSQRTGLKTLGNQLVNQISCCHTSYKTTFAMGK